jgi:dihydroorotase
METVIRNAKIVNEGRVYETDVLIKNQRIDRIGNIPDSDSARNEIDASGLFLLPGCIDDQVHFREPGLTHKGEIYTEAKAAVAGGITSYMEMPNTVPNTVTQELLQAKYKRADIASLANYSFFMGVTNNNVDEVIKTNPKDVCGIKIFLGSSTGDMLVDNEKTLETIFSNAPTLIALHCEDENIIKANFAKVFADFGDDIPLYLHPQIRSAEACYKSSSFAINLAKKLNTRLHILHISTAIETELFRNDIPLSEKQITSEACIHHLWFSDNDYATKGPWIKWNPAVKTINDRNAIRKALLDDRIDIIATDHAPHTIEEKKQDYVKAPSGGPLVQHALVALFEAYHQGKISIEKIVEKTAHNPAILFQIEKRGFVKVGYYGDLVIVNTGLPWSVKKENILYKCGWSPFEGFTFRSRITHTFVNGQLVYANLKVNDIRAGKGLAFDR